MNKHYLLFERAHIRVDDDKMLGLELAGQLEYKLRDPKCNLIAHMSNTFIIGATLRAKSLRNRLKFN